MNLSLLENMFNNIKAYSSYNLMGFKKFIYGDIYYVFFLVEYNDHECNPNNDSNVENIINIMMNEAERAYNKTVDKIGDKFYYLQKNLELVLFNKKSNLKSIATGELNYKIYNISILHPEEIIQGYNDNKNGKNYKFDDIKQYFKKLNKNKIFDVNTVKKKSDY